MTPPTLRAFRLRLWLPLVLVAASTLIFLILLGLEQHNHTQALQRFADQTAHEELLRTQRRLEAVLRRGDGSGLDGTLSELGLNPAITHAALVDDAGVVLAATRFAWRGLMIDTARHFMSVESLKRQIDAMEQVKLNVLHLHLSDNEAFRVESRRYPRLHEVASHGQFYTQAEIAESEQVSPSAISQRVRRDGIGLIRAADEELRRVR